MEKIKTVFREDSRFKVFLLSVLITGLSYGLYKGMLDNFLAEVVGMDGTAVGDKVRVRFPGGAAAASGGGG